MADALFTTAGREAVAERLALYDTALGYHHSVDIAEEGFTDKQTGKPVPDQEVLGRLILSCAGAGARPFLDDDD